MNSSASCEEVSLLTYLATMYAAASLMSGHSANCLDASPCLLFHTVLNWEAKLGVKKGQCGQIGCRVSRK